MIANKRIQYGQDLLLLDAGDTLLGRPMSLQSEGRVMIEAMNAMGYDALAIGDGELSLGLATLLARQSEAKFPFLSANLATQAGDLVATPYVILERAGLRIGIIGLTEPEAVELDAQQQVAVLDPVETARQYVQELRPQVDVLIVLSHLGIDRDQALAWAVPGIDIIVGGATRQLMKAPLEANGTLIVQQGSLGEYVGLLTVNYDAQLNVLEATEGLITLGPEVSDDPEMARQIEEWSLLYPSPTPEPTPLPQPLEPTGTE